MTSKEDINEAAQRVFDLLAQQGGPDRALQIIVRIVSTMIIMSSDSREEAVHAAGLVGKDLIQTVAKNYDRVSALTEGLEELVHGTGTRQ